MSDAAPHHGQLVFWLKANALILSLATSIILASATILFTSARWVSTNEHLIEANQGAIARSADAILTLQADMKSVDGRINRLGDRVTELNNQSLAADATMREKIGVLDERSKFAVERATQPNLPIPTGARR
jgi:hypothetical protein